MAVVRPFRALRYNQELIPRLSDVVVPPYDVISPQDLVDLKKRHPDNFSNIILADGEHKYEKAVNLLRQLIQRRILIRDEQPAFYLYRQDFKLDRYELFCQGLSTTQGQETFSRFGFFAAVGVEDYAARVVFPHEKTFSEPKEDRYKLMEATGGQMEPVFLGFEGESLGPSDFDVMTGQGASLHHFEDQFGVTHSLWGLSETSVVKNIQNIFDTQKLFILDGHHRYETALKFHRDHTPQKGSHGFILAALCPFKQMGLIVLPTHRLLKEIPGFSTATFLEKLEKIFRVSGGLSLDQLETRLMNTRSTAFGLCVKEKPGFFFLEKITSDNGALDLDVLHEKVLPEIFGGTDHELHGIFYEKSIPLVEKGVKQGDYQCGLLVRPTTYKEVMETALQAKKMPHKSTFFYPKIPSGLTIRLFDEDIS